jgi:hypothetical protein
MRLWWCGQPSRFSWRRASNRQSPHWARHAAELRALVAEVEEAEQLEGEPVSVPRLLRQVDVG